ncbi:hypothetical protein IWQ60_007822 [Tieghemiomyces parasiticus]|uniref:Extracellular metalloproteinase n=1 Tax=Tieghemiomyces parasiticus TaxID=78921 RepID=A0A9W7ZVA0_9FUNG|nr:hypothetical protein IWQ60_007822 [Tieghemiomyces parasiticus]
MTTGKRVLLLGLLMAAAFTTVRGIASEPDAAGLSFGPDLGHRYYDTSVQESGVSTDTDDPLEVVREFLLNKFGLTADTYVVTDHYHSVMPPVHHVYLRQVLRGLPVANARMNINIDGENRIVSYGSSFVLPSDTDTETGASSEVPRSNGSTAATPSSEAASNTITPNHGASDSTGAPRHFRRSENTLSATEALLRVADFLDTPVADPSAIAETVQGSLTGEGPVMSLQGVDVSADAEDVPVELAFLVTETGELIQVYGVILRTDLHWVHAFVDAQTGQVLECNSWTSHAHVSETAVSPTSSSPAVAEVVATARPKYQYRVLPLGTTDPHADQRRLVNGTEIGETYLAHWHDLGNGTTFTDTQGNNVYAQVDATGHGQWQNLPRPQGGANLVFDSPINLADEPERYTDAAVTNLFYWSNILHDVFLNYGFDEPAGNFQHTNFATGTGQGGDPVIASGQNGAGTNNADFATPPDGRSPRMRMYLWTQTTPRRDGDLENDIIIHEYGHGISTRLTGGSANSNCLAWGESRGMGEGWSDFFSVVFRTQAGAVHQAFPSAVASEVHSASKVDVTETVADSLAAVPDMVVGEYVMGSKGVGIRRYPYSTSLTRNQFTYASLNTISIYDAHTIGTVWGSILYEVLWGLLAELPFQPDLYTASLDHGNTLALQLVVTGLKLQPCRPTFIDARDAIFQAEELLIHGQYKCTLWRAFAKRGLGFDAKRTNRTYIDGHALPEGC